MKYCGSLKHFSDYEKAFDMSLHTQIFDILRQIDIDKKIRRISHLYWVRTANVKLQNYLMSDVSIKRIVHQGCVLSAMLYILYLEYKFERLWHQ